MKKILFILLVILLGLKTKAQFEQKLTLQFSSGYSILQSGITDWFKSGFTIDGGVQYNFNRQFSLVTQLKYVKYFVKDDVLGGMIKGSYNNLGISLCPKYSFLKEKSYHPYVFAGVSINYIKYNFETFESKAPLCFGYIVGSGIEFDINENFSLFTQFGYNSIKFKNNSGSKNINSVFVQIGFNLNLFKSKSI